METDGKSRITGHQLVHRRAIFVEVVGIHESNRGRCCANHGCCGTETLGLNSVVRLRVCKVDRDLGGEGTAVEAVLVNGGVDSCRVGFLPAYMLPDQNMYNLVLAQVTFFYGTSQSKRDVSNSIRFRGMCKARVIDWHAVYPENEFVIDTRWPNSPEKSPDKNETHPLEIVSCPTSHRADHDRRSEVKSWASSQDEESDPPMAKCKVETKPLPSEVAVAKLKDATVDCPIDHCSEVESSATSQDDESYSSLAKRNKPQRPWQEQELQFGAAKNI
jgi:hypothetical protein